MDKERCEECKEYRISAHRRPELGGRVLCNDHYYRALRRLSPTGIWRRPKGLPSQLGETMSQKRDVNEEKTCACGAKMIKYRFVDEKGRESVRWVCSMGFLCRYRRKKAACP